MTRCGAWAGPARVAGRGRRRGSHRPTPVGRERTIKALSAEQIDDLMNGRGMGLALPAELNGYPGPRHVLELADELELTPDQLARTRALLRGDAPRAITLGEQIVAREAALDELFASGTATRSDLRDATAALGRLSGRLRAHHLGYHLAMRACWSAPDRDVSAAAGLCGSCRGAARAPSSAQPARRPAVAAVAGYGITPGEELAVSRRNLAAGLLGLAIGVGPVRSCCGGGRGHAARPGRPRQWRRSQRGLPRGDRSHAPGNGDRALGRCRPRFRTQHDPPSSGRDRHGPRRCSRRARIRS